MDQMDFVELLREGKVEELREELKAQPSWVRREILADHCPERLGKGRGGNRPLALACLFGHTKAIDLLLAAGADPEHRNDENRTAFHVALEHNFNAVKHLVQIRMERDIVACACLHDHAGVRELVQQNPALANDDSTGLSVLGWATYYGARESAQILLDAGAQPTRGELNCAAGIGNVDMGKLLLDKGADIHARAADSDWTALHVAAAHLYTNDAAPFVDLLLKRGADPKATAGERELTALDIARVGDRRQKDQRIEAGNDQWKNFRGVIELLEATG